MSEYLLLLASAIVSALVNITGRFRPRRPDRVLVVKLDHLGDLILATPALRALRDGLPGVPIDALVATGSLAVIERNPGIDRIFVYDSPRYRRPRERSARTGSSRGPGALPLLRAARYTTVVELRGDWWTLLLPFRIGARRRVDRGSVRLRDWVARRVSRRAGARPPLHEVETNLEIVRPLLKRKTPDPPRLEIFLPAAAQESLTRKLAALGVDTDAPIICVHPGAAWRPRAWRPERFAAVADWIEEHYHAQVAFLGSEDERDIEAEVRSKSKGSRSFWLAGTLSVMEVAVLFQSARLLIANDSGLGHLAAATGLPSVILFGPNTPERFRPWSDRSLVLHHRVHCCPCRQVVCIHPENPCVNLIEIEEVKARVREVLGTPEGDPVSRAGVVPVSRT